MILRRQADPGRELPPRSEHLGCRSFHQEQSRADRTDAGDIGEASAAFIGLVPGANRGLVESGKRTPSAGSGLRDDLRLYLPPLPKGRTTLALSHAPSQTPASAPIEALARYDQRSGLHP